MKDMFMLRQGLQLLLSAVSTCLAG